MALCYLQQVPSTPQERMMNHRLSPIPGSLPFPATRPHFRLVTVPGFCHQELDALYETQDAAWMDALHWWTERGGDPACPCDLGVEVSTLGGQWRTVRHPGCADIRGNTCALPAD
jgi:hypothetical protein